MKKKGFDFFPLIIAFFAVVSYSRVLFFRDVFWDDNCWLMAAYSSSNLDQFLNTGFYELRRVPMGAFLYYLFSLHKTTNHPYLIWHTINIIVQVITPIFLYLFIKGLFKGKEVLSLFIAVSFVVFPLDYTLPYLTVISYRIAIMLTMTSFYLIVKALEKDKPEYFLFLTAILMSIISYYVFLESTVFFELARLFVIGYIFYSKGTERKLLARKAVIYWLPFFLFCIPLVSYKLIFKPYGIYEGVYKADFLFFLKGKEHVRIIKILLFNQWKILLKYIGDIRVLSIVLSLFTVVFSFLILKKISVILKIEKERGNADFSATPNEGFKDNLKFVIIVLLIGILCLLPQILLLEFAGREIAPGMNTSHFLQLQIGYAIILGGFLYYLYRMLLHNSHFKMHWLNLIFSLIIGAGVFFNNLNLDLFFKAHERQDQFWKVFINRFPALPENATFMMDVRDFYFYDATDLDNSYDLEFILNLLYANSKRPKDFRRYKVFPLEEFKPEMADRFRCNQVNEERLERVTHFGKDALNPCEFIIVYYRDGKLMVNGEIKEMFPNIPYREWLNNDFPELPDKPAAYPLRYNLNGFLNGNT